jgi:hypothetical protein
MDVIAREAVFGTSAGSPRLTSSEAGNGVAEFGGT